MFLRYAALSTIGLACLGLTGCADPNAGQDQDQTNNTTQANVGYISFTHPKVDLSSISPMRKQALVDGATALGEIGRASCRERV